MLRIPFSPRLVALWSRQIGLFAVGELPEENSDDAEASLGSLDEIIAQSLVREGVLRDMSQLTQEARAALMRSSWFHVGAP